LTDSKVKLVMWFTGNAEFGQRTWHRGTITGYTIGRKPHYLCHHNTASDSKPNAENANFSDSQRLSQPTVSWQTQHGNLNWVWKYVKLKSVIVDTGSKVQPKKVVPQP